MPEVKKNDCGPWCLALAPDHAAATDIWGRSFTAENSTAFMVAISPGVEVAEPVDRSFNNWESAALFVASPQTASPSPAAVAAAHLSAKATKGVGFVEPVDEASQTLVPIQNDVANAEDWETNSVCTEASECVAYVKKGQRWQTRLNKTKTLSASSSSGSGGKAVSPYADDAINPSEPATHTTSKEVACPSETLEIPEVFAPSLHNAPKEAMVPGALGHTKTSTLREAGLALKLSWKEKMPKAMWLRVL